MTYKIEIELDDRLENTAQEIINHLQEYMDGFSGDGFSYTIFDENTCDRCATEYGSVGECNCEG